MQIVFQLLLKWRPAVTALNPHYSSSIVKIQFLALNWNLNECFRTSKYTMMFSQMVLWKGEWMTTKTLWSHRTDHCALLISLRLKQLSLSPCVFAVCLSVLLFPSPFLPFFLIPSFPAPCANNCHPVSVSPPAGVWLVISGGRWGSSQSRKWGSPPGWPRHSFVQVRKQAALPTKQRWER